MNPLTRAEHVQALKVLILGGAGMLGHKTYQVLKNQFQTWVTFRRYDDDLRSLNLFDDSQVIDGIDALEFSTVERAIQSRRPDVVINCIGLIKQLKLADNPKLSIYTNALFPHLLAETCALNAARLIHISTDCVYSGRKGNYTERDASDAEDLYGRTKFLGEVAVPHALTLRTSIIGHELHSKVSLVDWFLSNRHATVRGFTNAVYTGFPTVTFCAELAKVITDFPMLSGVYHVSSAPISKYELLNLLNNRYGCGAVIEPFEDFRMDRSLDSTRYREATGFFPKPWGEMVNEMFNDYLNSQYYERVT